MSASTTWIGVDVSKKYLDVASACGAPARVANDVDGRTTLARRLKAESTAGVVVEATGGLERAIVEALTAEGVVAAIVNPARVRKFAEGVGQLAKTDRIDAQILARFGDYMKPPPTILADAHRQELRDLVAYRAQITGELTARKAQLASYSTASVRERAQVAIDRLVVDRKAIDAAIEVHIAADAGRKETARRLRTAKGVGPVVAATLIAELPELGMISRQKLASLAGVAPFAHDSAERRGYRRIKGGRAEVRQALYNAARVAIRHDARMSAFYEALRARNKAHKVAIVAVMRKLLTQLNAMLKTQTDWKPTKP
jgi:transposase